MILDRIFERRASISLINPRDPGIVNLFGGGTETAAGVQVTPERAMRLSVVYAAVRIIAESIASLPLSIHRITNDGSEVDTEHPYFELLHDAPNRWQTSFEWREMMLGHCVLRGNAYSEIISSRRRLLELVPLHPDRVTPFKAPDGTLAYEYRPEDGPSRIILSGEMHHLRGLSNDGFVGISPVDQIRDAIGLTAAAEEYGARFYKHGSAPGGVLETPNKLSDDAYNRLKTAWEARFQGVHNAHRAAILEQGLQWKAVGIEPDKAQFLETRKFQITDIARAFRIPPHMLADLERATFSNVEHQGLEFVTYTLLPWIVRWEQAIKRDLLTAYKKTHFVKFNVAGLLRGDLKSRYDAYATGRNWGWFSVNDIRKLEDMNTIEGGDQYLAPLNMTTPDRIENPPEPQPAVSPASGSGEVVTDAARRVIRAQVRALRRALTSSKGDGEDLDRRFAEFLKSHASFMHNVLGPSLRMIGRDADSIVRSHIHGVAETLSFAIKAGNVGEVLDEWDESGADKLITYIYAGQAL